MSSSLPSIRNNHPIGVGTGGSHSLGIEKSKVPSDALNPKPVSSPGNMTEALEELAMNMDPRGIGGGTKSLKKRNVSISRGKEDVEKIEKISEVFNDLQEKGMRSSFSSLTNEAIKHFSEGKSLNEWKKNKEDDPAVNYVVLTNAMFRTEQTNPDISPAIENALEQLQENQNSEIKAGVNTAKAFNQFGDRIHKKDLRDVYYEAIVDKESIASMFEVMLDKLPPDLFQLNLLAMRRALSDDLNAMASSIDKSSLKILLKKLEDSKNISSIVKDADEIITRIKLNSTSRIDSLGLAKEMISTTRKTIPPGHMENLIGDITPPSEDQKREFFNDFYNRMKGISSTIWLNDSVRERNLEVMYKDIIATSGAANLSSQRR